MTAADLFRLEAKLGLSFWEIAVRWADPEGQIARNYAPHFYFEDDPHTPFVICLKQTESVTFPETQKCMFLREDPPDALHPHGTARCGVYEARPQTCRVFPMRFDSTNSVVVLHPLPEYGRDEHHPAFRLCPREWTTADTDPLGSVQELVVARYEMRFFKDVAAGWNRQPGSWNVFPEFLRTVYSNRVVTQEQLDMIEQARQQDQQARAA